MGVQATVEPGPGQSNARLETIDNARDLLDELLADLPEQQREIMHLFHRLDWSIAEIAEQLNMPQGTVKSHLHRGRGRMKRMILADRTRQRHAEELWS